MFHSIAELMVSGSNLSISGGGLDGEYVFSCVHFHWGEDDTQGSEHFLGGVNYPLEVKIFSLLDRSEINGLTTSTCTCRCILWPTLINSRPYKKPLHKTTALPHSPYFFKVRTNNKYHNSF